MASSRRVSRLHRSATILVPCRRHHTNHDGCERPHQGRWCSSIPQLKPNVTVQDHGATAKIKFPSGELSIFHAPWLWSNDPTFIHPTSGQRLRTAASYTGQMIQSANIILSTEVSDVGGSESGNAEAVRPIPPPPPGCLHPIGTVFATTSDNNIDVTNHHQWLLQVCWEPTKCNGHSTTNNVLPQVSYYDLTWLQQCRYDASALQQLRRRTKIDSCCRLSHIQDDKDHQLWQVGFDQLFHNAALDCKPDPNVLFDLLNVSEEIVRQISGVFVSQNASTHTPCRLILSHSNIATVHCGIWCRHGNECSTDQFRRIRRSCGKSFGRWFLVPRCLVR